MGAVDSDDGLRCRIAELGEAKRWIDEQVDAAQDGRWIAGLRFATSGFKSGLSRPERTSSVVFTELPHSLLTAMPRLIPANGIHDGEAEGALLLPIHAYVNLVVRPNDDSAHTENEELVAFFKRCWKGLLERLPGGAGDPARRVAFLFGDSNEPVHEAISSRFFSQAASKAASALPLFYRTELHPLLGETPITEAVHDVGFRGCELTHEVRAALKRMLDAGIPAGRVAKLTWMPRWGLDYGRTVRLWMKLEYAQELATARFVLCPRGVAANSIRFFEAMLFGRIPVLISDDAVLPLADRIRYDDFMVRVPEKELDTLWDRIREFEKTHDLVVASKAAREAYDTWFRDRRFGAFLRASLAA